MGFAILCVSLLYSIFLNIIFFSKKHIKTYETKMFSTMMVSNLIGIVLEFSCIVSIYFLGTENLLVVIINKLFLVYLLTFAILFSMYAAYITLIDGTEEVLSKKHNKIRIVAAITELLMSILVLITPIELYSSNGVMYSAGTAANVVYFVSAMCTLLCTVMMIFKFKNIKRKKTLLLFAYIIGCGSVALIQQMNPALTLATSMETFLIFLMYNTIENPDVKMIHQLDVAKEQAEKANRAKTDFLSSMSHEIRTPLNAIVGFSDYIMTSETLEEAKENAQDIVNASQTLLEIVNGILDISKIESGKLEIINSKYTARKTFENLGKLITPKMEEKGLDFSYYIAPDIPETLFGDHSNIKKVVTNLLSNAYKYTEEGFVRYEVNCINSPGITKLIITVEDSGRGIKKENIDKLFTKFQRLDEDKNTTIEGTGLGLAITKQLVELMGGKILVHTVYGEGSKFTVVLNQRIESTPVEEQEEIKTTLDLKDKKILIVDDNSLNIKVANKLLERYNANNITSIDNGFDCLELIKSGELFDIILMDDMMPKMSGVETFHKLKELPGFNQPVVILTANAITGMKHKYLKQGFDGYLAKPIEKKELIKVCNIIFAKYQKNSLENKKPEKVDQPDDSLEKTEQLEILEEDNASKKTLTGNETYLRENGVDLDKALELLGDIEMYNMTIGDFLNEVETKWQSIIEYKNANDMENYAIEVHSLKSDAKYLGFMSLAEISYQHELKSKDNDSSFINDNFGQLETEYNKALEIVKTYNEMVN